MRGRRGSNDREHGRHFAFRNRIKPRCSRLHGMKTPRELQPLLDDGTIDAVLRRLKSGKEASVFLVQMGSEVRCAKVYKDAERRGFHNLAAYQEGRKVRGSREARAVGRGGRHGRAVQESAWKEAEVTALYQLRAAGIRVPQPVGIFDGVLLMEVIRDAEGAPAPRLSDVSMPVPLAREWHVFMIRQIVQMLCAGLIHGDLSEFNVLVDAAGPVIIDLPQAVNAAGNNSAFRLLERDVNNMREVFGRVDPEILKTEYAHEIWALFEAGNLRPDSPLTGLFEHDNRAADVDAVLTLIEDERQEAERRAERLAMASQR